MVFLLIDRGFLFPSKLQTFMSDAAEISFSNLKARAVKANSKKGINLEKVENFPILL